MSKSALKKRAGPTIVEWISGQMTNPARIERYGAVKEFRLVHLNANREPDMDVSSFPVPENPDATVIQSVAESVSEAAAIDAQTLINNQTYAAMAMFDDEGELVCRARYVFNVQGESGLPTTDGFNTEPPNAMGMVAQSQRHLESVWRLANMSQAQAMATMASQNEKLTQMLENYNEKLFEMGTLIGDLTMKKAEADAVRETARNASTLKDQAMKEALALAPMVAKKILGIKLLGDGKSPAAQALAKLAVKLSPEKINQMLAPLDPEDQAAAMMLIEEALKLAQEEQQTAEGSNNGGNAQ